MKKIIITMSVCIVMLMVANCYIYADEKTINESEDSSVTTISDAEMIMQDYFDTQKLDLEIGSEEYIEYLTDLLIYENDEVLKKNPQYDNIKLYASEYLSQLYNPKTTVCDGNKVLLNAQECNKTISEVRQEAELETTSNVMEIVPAENSTLAQASYNDTKAVNYAKKWAKSRNPEYNNYGADCTNFASQCIKAGGKSMKKPSPIPKGIKETTKYWYSVRYEDWHTNNPVYTWRESTSFIRVSDFYTYWKNKGIPITNYSSKSKLQNGVSIGDVVQLKNGDGKWFHTIIITGGSKGNRTYCGHSTNRLDEPVKNISGAVSYRALEF